MPSFFFFLKTAPEGCLQWYTGATGTVASYNFQGGTHLANQDYEACVRTEQGNCQINWATAGTTSFGLTSSASNTESVGDICSIDYIVIPAGFNSAGTVTMTDDRYCGSNLFNQNAAGTVSCKASAVHGTTNSFIILVLSQQLAGFPSACGSSPTPESRTTPTMWAP